MNLSSHRYFLYCSLLSLFLIFKGFGIEDKFITHQEGRLEKLDIYLQVKILSYLEPCDLAHVARLNNYFYNISKENQLWYALLGRDLMIAGQELETYQDENYLHNSYKDIYLELYLHLFPENLITMFKATIFEERFARCDLVQHIIQDIRIIFNGEIKPLPWKRYFMEFKKKYGHYLNQHDFTVITHHKGNSTWPTVFKDHGIAYEGDIIDILLKAHEHRLPLKRKGAKLLPFSLSDNNLERYKTFRDFKFILVNFYQTFDKFMSFHDKYAFETDIDNSQSSYRCLIK